MKKAILVVSFGVSSKEARERSLDICENLIKVTFTSYDIYKAYSSKRIIEKINKRENLVINTPIEALDKLYQLDYDFVFIQPLYFTYGNEFYKLQHQTKQYKYKFKQLILGFPLVTNEESMLKVVNAINAQLPVLNPNEALVLMGHGTLTYENNIYSKIEYIFRTNGVNAYVGTLKGDYNINIIIERLHKTKIQKVVLMPLLLTIGHHVMEDMIGKKEDSWKSMLIRNGYEVEVKLQALGEIPSIANYYVELINKYLR